MGPASGRRAAGRHRDEGRRGVDRRARRWTPLLVGDDGSPGSRHSRSPARGPSGRRRDGRSLQGRIRQEAERQTLEAAARARAELERRQAAAAEEMARLQTESETPNTAALGIGAAESELREVLRLEELERRTRSLRALPVAQSYRDPNATAESSEADGPGTEVMRPTRMWRSSRTRSKRLSPPSSSRSGRSRASWRRSSFSSGPLASLLLVRPPPGRRLPPSARHG